MKSGSSVGHYDEELGDFYRLLNVVGLVKCRRLRLAGRVARIVEKRNP
jgi:hypothetical protein